MLAPAGSFQLFGSNFDQTLTGIAVKVEARTDTNSLIGCQVETSNNHPRFLTLPATIGTWRRYTTEVDPIGPLRLKVGQVARLTKTVTDEDLRLFAQLTGDYNPLHFSDEFAGRTRFGRRVAQGGIAAGLLNTLVAMKLPGPGTVFMSQSLNYRRPVYIGDTLIAAVEIIALKMDKPVCQLSFSVTNQVGETVLDAEAWTYTLRPDLEEPRT